MLGARTVRLYIAKVQLDPIDSLGQFSRIALSSLHIQFTGVDVKSELNDKLIDAYRENGFLVIENFLSDAELEQWRSSVGEAIQERIDKHDGLSNQDDPTTFYANVFTQCLRLADTSPAIAHLVRDERLGRLAGELAGSTTMRIWHDQALVKGPFSNPTSWHNDVPFWSFYSRKSVNMWFALDDATLANGCLWYLPGTHLSATYDSVGISENFEGIIRSYPQWRELEAIPAACPAGSLVIHNGLIAHAAGPNITPRPRRAMTSAYFPDGEVYNGRRDTLTKYTDTLAVGEALNDDTYVPIVWHA